MNILVPGEPHRLGVPLPASVPPLTGPAEARAWLDAHRATLRAVVSHAADHSCSATRSGSPSPSGAISRPDVTTRRSSPSATMHWGPACRLATAGPKGKYWTTAATSTCGRAGTSRPRTALPVPSRSTARPGTGQVRPCALGHLGIAESLQGSYDQAVQHYQQALVLYRDTSARGSEARVLNNLSLIDVRQGRYQQAASRLRHSLEAAGDFGDSASLALVLATSGSGRIPAGPVPASRRRAGALTGTVPRAARSHRRGIRADQSRPPRPAAAPPCGGP